MVYTKSECKEIGIPTLLDTKSLPVQPNSVLNRVKQLEIGGKVARRYVLRSIEQRQLITAMFA